MYNSSVVLIIRALHYVIPSDNAVPCFIILFNDYDYGNDDSGDYDGSDDGGSDDGGDGCLDDGLLN